MLDLLERRLDWVRWHPGRPHLQLVEINLQVGDIPVGVEVVGGDVEGGDTAVPEYGVLEGADGAVVEANDDLLPQGLV